MTGMWRTRSTPGVSQGTRTMLCWRWLSASGSVLPITISSLQSGCAALVMNTCGR